MVESICVALSDRIDLLGNKTIEDIYSITYCNVIKAQHILSDLFFQSISKKDPNHSVEVVSMLSFQCSNKVRHDASHTLCANTFRNEVSRNEYLPKVRRCASATFTNLYMSTER